MPPIAETVVTVTKEATNIVKEAAKEAIKEGAKKALNEGAKKATEKIFSEKTGNYAKQYLSGESPALKSKIEIARKNSEARRALLNGLFDGKLKGTLNEQERISDLKPHCVEFKTEVVSKDGKNRIDIFGKTKNPVKYTELCYDENRGIYTKNCTLPKGESFAYECKDGTLHYLKSDMPHIAQQVKAGKELSGGNSFLQITPETLESLKLQSPTEQKSFMQPIIDVGGKMIIDGTTSKERILAIREAIKTKPIEI